MKKFFVLLKKEIRELLTPQMILPLVMIVVVFYFIGQVAGSESKKTQFTRAVSVMDLDHTDTSKQISAILIQHGFQVEVSNEVDKDIALIKAKEDGKKAFVYIPNGFQNNLRQNLQSNLEVFYIIRSFSFAGSSRIDLTPALTAANQALSAQLLQQAAPNTDIQKATNPLIVHNNTIINSKSAPLSIQEVTGFVTSQATFIPIVLMLVITFAATLIATSIASEKENKTLETLLSSPVNRNAIVAAKLVAAGLIALISSGFYLFGLNSYLKGLTEQAGQGGAPAFNQAAIEQLGITMSGPDYLMLGGILFLGILTALSIALILGSMAEDTKGAQGVISPLMVLVLIPYFLIFFLDLETVSSGIKWLVYAIPFTHVFMAAPNIMLGQYQPVIYGMIYLAVLFLVFIYIAGKIFSTDKILTLKLNFGKKK